MLLSIVIPVYNTYDYLEKCVSSACSYGDREKYEVLLIDDGSTDGKSGEKCDEFEKKYQNVKVIHQQNKGLGGARNTGIEKSSGEYLLFVDSDDHLSSDAVEILCKALEEKKPDILSFGLNSVTEDGKVTPVFPDQYKSDIPFTALSHPEILLSLPAAWCRVWKKGLFIKNDIFYPEKVWYEDIRTTLKLFAEGNIVTLDKYLYNYLQRRGSIMHSEKLDRNIEIIYAFDDIKEYFKSKGIFGTYFDELCYICIFNVYLTSSVRIIRSDAKHPLLSELKKYLKENFPDYKNNKYLKTMPKGKKAAFFLLENKCYFLLRLLFGIKG